MHNKSQIN